VRSVTQIYSRDFHAVFFKLPESIHTRINRYVIVLETGLPWITQIQRSWVSATWLMTWASQSGWREVPSWWHPERTGWFSDLDPWPFWQSHWTVPAQI